MTPQKKVPRFGWWLCGIVTLMAVVAVIVVWQKPWGNRPVGTLRVGPFPIKEGEMWERLLDVTVSPGGGYVACKAVFAPLPPNRLKTRMVIIPLQVPAPTPMWLDTRFLVMGGFTWSPDGSALAFWGEHKGDRPRIMVCDIHTRLLRAITAADKDWLSNPGFLEWSPTGEWLAFERGRWPGSSSLGWDLWVVRPDGSEFRQVTNHGLVRPFFGNYWSPDGSQLYYAKQRELGKPVGDVYSVDTGVDDKAEERITHNLAVEYIAGASPDGQHLLCAVRGKRRRSSLPSESEFEQNLLYLPIADPDGAYVVLHDWTTAAFSPNGQEIAYVDYEYRRKRAGGTLSLTDAQRGYELYKMPLSDIRAKSELARGVRGLAWKGAWTVQHQVVFTRDDSTSIWVVNEDGTNQQEIFRLQD